MRNKRIEENLAIISTLLLTSKAEKILPWSLSVFFKEEKSNKFPLDVSHSLN